MAERIRKKKDEHVRDVLLDMKSRLGSSYSVYLGLVPFGSVSIRVKEQFLADMTSAETPELALLVREGVCTRSQDDTELLLTEHPFQLRRTLAYIDERKTEPAAVRCFAQPCESHPATTLGDAVLSRYVQRSAVPVDALRTLTEHAEWAGVLDHMASAARYLMKATSDDALREVAREIAMKFSRTAYPRDEKAHVGALKQDLRWWETQRAAAAVDPAEICAGRRLDYILYEEAYGHYLLEDYARAASMFRAAVKAGFRAIDRALDRAERTADTIRRAQFALANIWVAGLLERGAALRGHMLDVLKGVSSVSTERMARLTDGVAAIYQALERAWGTGDEGLATGQPFLNAAREALCPEHSYATVELTIDLRERLFTDFLRRHRLNAWLHTLETSSWPWLLLPSAPPRCTVPDVPAPSVSIFTKLAPLSDRDSRVGYRFRQIELLYRASGGEQLAPTDALQVAAMFLAGGSFEHLGDHLLLAWRTASTTEDRRAIAWFLRERVPNVGFNSLPKLALDQFEHGDPLSC